VHVVVNHLHLRDPLTEETTRALSDAVQLVVDGGGLSAQVAKVDERHLILLLTFANAEQADRVAREVGGPFMRDHVVPLLARDTDRSLGEVIASASLRAE